MNGSPARTATAVHIGADVLDSPDHARWAKVLSCLDTVERLTRLCHAAGVRSQQRLLGVDATVAQVREAIMGSVGRIGPDGLLVLTFSGHSERAVPGEHYGGWCLRDGVLRHTRTAELLAAAPPSARIIVIAETCYAAAFADVFAAVPATTVLLAACAENQATLNLPHSEFVAALERLTFPDGSANPQCTSYAWLRRELRRGTPDVERPDIRANRPNALRQHPFQPTGVLPSATRPRYWRREGSTDPSGPSSSRGPDPLGRSCGPGSRTARTPPAVCRCEQDHGPCTQGHHSIPEFPARQSIR